MKLLFMILCFSIAFCDGTNLGLNIVYHFKTKVNQFFNREFQFNRSEAEELFMQEQNGRIKNLERLQQESIKRNEQKFQHGICKRDFLYFKWYLIAYKVFRLFFRFFSAGKSELTYLAERKRLAREENCENVITATETCLTAFEHSFFVRHGWTADLTRKAECKCKTVVAYRPLEKHTSQRCLVQCPAIGPVSRDDSDEYPDTPTSENGMVSFDNSINFKKSSNNFESPHKMITGGNSFSGKELDLKSEDSVCKRGKEYDNFDNYETYDDQYERLEQFNVYISSTDKRSHNHLIYFVFIDHPTELVPIIPDVNEEDFKSKGILTQVSSHVKSQVKSAVTKKVTSAIKVDEQQSKNAFKKVMQFMNRSSPREENPTTEKAIKVKVLLMNKNMSRYRHPVNH